MGSRHLNMDAVTNAPGSQLGKCVMFRLVTNVNNYNINVWVVDSSKKRMGCIFFGHEHMKNTIILVIFEE